MLPFGTPITQHAHCGDYGSYVMMSSGDVDDLVGHDVQEHNGARMCQIISGTVGQYTGVDDRNGSEIYGGDILRMYKHSDITHKHEVAEAWHDGKYQEDIREVKFHLGAFYTVASYGIEQAFLHMARPGQSFEVIGNIHDNPELLK